MTKAEEVFTKVEALVASGKTKAAAFKQLAAEYDQPLDSIRGSYYTHTRARSGGTSRPRRRETTPEDALADARAALERAIGAIDARLSKPKSAPTKPSASTRR